MRKSALGLYLSLAVSLQPCLVAGADPAGTSGGAGVTNYGTIDAHPPASTTPGATTSPSEPTPSSSSTNPDNWPWMKDQKAQSEQSGAKSPGTTLPTGSPFKMETPEASSSAPAAPVKPKPAEEEQHAAAQPKKPMKLFGRIEELAGRTGATFPALKAMTPKLDPRGVAPKQAVASQNAYSGQIVRSFPPAYTGAWGGSLQVQQEQLSQAFYSEDPEEARRTALLFRTGLIGAVNFTFENLGTNKVTLEPASLLFQVHDPQVGDQVTQMMGGGNSPMAAMMKQMAGNMNVPLVMHLGAANTAGNFGEATLSGEQFQSSVLKNDIRQLEPGVLEQQIITKQTYYAKGTGRARIDYGETVVRFIWRGPQQMYVQAASVNYDASKRFLAKTVLGGYVTKGQVMQTDPMAGMGNIQQMMPGLGNPNGGAIPGLDPNFMKQLMGQ